MGTACSVEVSVTVHVYRYHVLRRLIPCPAPPRLATPRPAPLLSLLDRRIAATQVLVDVECLQLP